MLSYSCAFIVSQHLLNSQDLQPHITSLTSMKAEHTIETAKDSNGGRVIEAFLTSNAATKQKRRLLIKYALRMLFVYLRTADSTV